MAAVTAIATSPGDATAWTAFFGWAILSIKDLEKGIVAFERTHDNGTTYNTIQTFNRNVEKNFYAPDPASAANTKYRLRAVDLVQYGGSGVALRLDQA